MDIVNAVQIVEAEVSGLQSSNDTTPIMVHLSPISKIMHPNDSIGSGTFDPNPHRYFQPVYKIWQISGKESTNGRYHESDMRTNFRYSAFD